MARINNLRTHITNHSVENLATYVFALLCLALLVATFAIVRHDSIAHASQNRAIAALSNDIDRLQKQLADAGQIPVVSDQQQAKDATGKTPAVAPIVPQVFFTTIPPKTTQTTGPRIPPANPQPTVTTIVTTTTTTTRVTPRTIPLTVPPIFPPTTSPPPSPTPAPTTTAPPIISLPSLPGLPLGTTNTTKAPVPTSVPAPIVVLPPVTVTIPPILCGLLC